MSEERALYAIQLASTYGLWVHRRVETFEFPAADTVRRRMSVDFTLPEVDELAVGVPVQIPIMTLKKGNLRHFDVCEGSGDRLSMLTTAQNGELTIAGLRRLLETSWRGADEDLTDLLLRIVEGDRDSAVETADRALREGGSLDGVLKRMAESDSQAQVATVLRSLIEELADGFLLLVPTKYEPGSRQLVKLSYDAPLRKPARGRRQRLYVAATRLGSGLGWTGRREDFEEIQVGWAESYHVEVNPPQDTWIAEAALEVNGEKPVRDRAPRLLRPHLRVGPLARDRTAELTLSVHPRRDSLITPLLFAAATIATILVLVPQHQTSLDGQTLGALLLLPLALSAFYVRPGEHSYVTMSIQGIRAIAAVPVVAGIFVLALVALGLIPGGGRAADPGALEAAGWAARASVLSVYLLLIAFLAPTVGRPARALVRFVEGRVGDRRPSTRLAAFGSLALAGLVVFGLPLVAGAYLLNRLLPF